MLYKVCSDCKFYGKINCPYYQNYKPLTPNSQIAKNSLACKEFISKINSIKY